MLNQRINRQERKAKAAPRAPQPQSSAAASAPPEAAPRPHKARRSLSDALLDRMAQMMLGNQ